MYEIEDISKVEDKLIVKYSKWSKILLVLTVLFSLWVVFVALTNIILKFEPTWALFTLDNWISVWCVVVGFFILFEIVFFFHYSSVRKKRLEQEKPKPEFIDGKRLHVYTYPKGYEGGIFSKTYIKIDDNNILRLRTLMIPPNELWEKKN